MLGGRLEGAGGILGEFAEQDLHGLSAPVVIASSLAG